MSRRSFSPQREYVNAGPKILLTSITSTCTEHVKNEKDVIRPFRFYPRPILLHHLYLFGHLFPCRNSTFI